MSAEVVALPLRKRRRRRQLDRAAEVMNFAEQKRLYGLLRQVQFVEKQRSLGAMTPEQALALLGKVQEQLEGGT